jgi:hypothetical protein
VSSLATPSSDLKNLASTGMRFGRFKYSSCIGRAPLFCVFGSSSVALCCCCCCRSLYCCISWTIVAIVSLLFASCEQRIGSCFHSVLDQVILTSSILYAHSDLSVSNTLPFTEYFRKCLKNFMKLIAIFVYVYLNASLSNFSCVVYFVVMETLGQTDPPPPPHRKGSTASKYPLTADMNPNRL